MTTIKRILCITDLSHVSRNAEMASLRLAKIFGAHLTVLSCGEYYVHVPEDLFDEKHSPYAEDYQRFFEQKKLDTFEHFGNLITPFGLVLEQDVSFEVRLENEVIATIDFLEEKKNCFDLIVVGKQHSTFWERLFFGSPAQEICNDSKVPTLLMPSGDEWINWTPGGVVVGTALNNHNGYATENFALMFARESNTPLTLIHVITASSLDFDLNVAHVFPVDYIPPQIKSSSLEELKQRRMQDLTSMRDELLKQGHCKDIQCQIEFGIMGDEILNFLEERSYQNLLIIGATGSNAIKKFFLGSKAETLEETCPIPLLVVHSLN